MTPTCTAVVIATDEAARIGPTLAALREVELPIVMVDGGSKDDTVAMAEAAGATVMTRPFDNFAAQRNWALDHVTSAYVLFVDADEIVTPELADEVRIAVNAGADAASVPTLDYFAGRWMVHGAWFPQRHIRLIRVGKARFAQDVHEALQLPPTASVAELNAPLLHVSHVRLSDYLQKLDRYTEIEARALHGRPTVLLLRGTAQFVMVLGHRLVLRGGWRDGVHGWVGAMNYAFYRFTIFAKAATAIPRDDVSVDAARLRWRGRRS
jgi:glycosyltransferase involved in cell wall biosynthesis